MEGAAGVEGVAEVKGVDEVEGVAEVEGVGLGVLSMLLNYHDFNYRWVFRM